MKNLIALLILIPSFLSAQKIDWDNFDSALYNKALGIEISKVRSNKIAPKYDTTLLKAAQYHGYYVAANDMVGHYDTTSAMSKTCSDRIRLFIPSASIVSYYTLCELDSNRVFDDSYSREIVCSFPLGKSKTYEDLAAEALKVYEKSPGHWDRVVYRDNGKRTSSTERTAGFIGLIDGRVYSVILFYDDKHYGENENCFHTLTNQMANGIHDSAVDYIKENNIDSKKGSTEEVMIIGGEQLKVSVAIDYINHIDEGLHSSTVKSNINSEFQKRKAEYIKKAAL